MPNGGAAGSFHHFYESDGFTYSLTGTVTCVGFDAGNYCAWSAGR